MRKLACVLMVGTLILAEIPMTAKMNVKAEETSGEDSLQEFASQVSQICGNQDTSSFITEVSFDQKALMVEDGEVYVKAKAFANKTNTAYEKEQKEVTYTTEDKEYETTVTVKKDSGSNYVPVEEVGEALGFEVSVSHQEEPEVTVTREFQTKRLIVKAKGDLDTLGASAVAEGYEDLHVLQYDTVEEAKAAYEEYEDMEGVLYVEPDAYISLETEGETVATYDASGYNSWGFEDMGMDILQEVIEDTYTSSQMQTVVVAVIDTGVNLYNSYFDGRTIDGGLSDLNFYSSSSTTPMDDNGHGTHVTGTVIDGTTSNVKVIPVKALGGQKGTGSVSQVAAAIEAVTQTSVQVDVVNMSFGIYGDYQSITTAIQHVLEDGTAVIAAAGNETMDASQVSPANIEGVITVSAMDEKHQRTEYTNYGEIVDFTAPGDHIKSINYEGTSALDTLTESGTSMATPHVTAAFAMMKTLCPAKDMGEIEDMIVACCSEDVGNDSTGTAWAGNGRILFEETNLALVAKGIYRRNIRKASITLQSDTYTYNGAAQTPAVQVLYNGQTLVEGTDYTVTASGNIDAGEASLSINGIGDYRSNVTKTYTIQAQDLSGASLTWDGSTYVADGNAKRPSITVTLNGRVLTLNTDYVIAYSNNVNPGQGTVTITGNKNYTGSLTGTFRISPGTVQQFVKMSATTKGVTIAWTSLNGVNGYEISRYNNKTKTYETIANVAAGSTSYKLSGLTGGKVQNLRIRGYVSIDGVNYYGDGVTLKTAANLKKTTSVKVRAQGNGKVKVTWKKIKNATGYEVYTSYKKNGSFKKQATISGGKKLTVVLKKLKKYKTCYVKVRGVKNIDGVKSYSKFSKVMKVTVK